MLITNAIKPLKTAVLLTVVSLVIAVGVNFVSPKKLPYLGQWDPSRGVITPVPGSLDYSAEIQSVGKTKTLYDTGQVVFVDARSEEAYLEGHIKGAVSLPVGFYFEKIESFTARYPLSRYLVTYCSGRQCEDSHHLAQMLRDEGYTHVSVFIDGYPGWESEGYPIEHGNS